MSDLNLLILTFVALFGVLGLLVGWSIRRDLLAARRKSRVHAHWERQREDWESYLCKSKRKGVGEQGSTTPAVSGVAHS